MLCLLVASLVASTTLHASELPGLISIECAEVAHSDSGQTQSPGEADKAMPHHHGCHSASSFMPGENPMRHNFDPSNALFAPADTKALACRHSGPDLRPPIA